MRQPVNLVEYGVEIRIKGETGMGIVTVYIDVTSHSGDQRRVVIDLDSTIRQTAAELLPMATIIATLHTIHNNWPKSAQKLTVRLYAPGRIEVD